MRGPRDRRGRGAAITAWGLAVALVAGATVTPAQAQAPAPSTAQEEKKPPTLQDEIKLLAYVENSYTVNLTGAGRDATNELRLYDLDEGYTFNIAELSVKKDPSEGRPWGFGLVVTAGIDSQKNHSLGIFRGLDDAFPYRNTRKFDLQEAHVSALLPLGSGLTIKLGKWPTLIGYEVFESPLNLNVSRGYLFTFAAPGTHTGGLLTYGVAEWLTVLFGIVNGWDNADDNNGGARTYTGQLAFVPLKDMTASFNWIAGPEQNGNKNRIRYVLDGVLGYTGVAGLTLGVDAAYGHEEREAFLEALGTRVDTDAAWWGVAGYAAYDWTDRLRTALRQEYFQDTDGARTGFGKMLRLSSTTATAQYKIWKGLVGRLEYRHDHADEKAFKVRVPGVVPTSRTLDTLSVSLHYQFF